MAPLVAGPDIAKRVGIRTRPVSLMEVNGMYRGRFIYSLGANSGANVDTRTSENATAHLGFKLGGMRLDGENGTRTTGNPPPNLKVTLTGLIEHANSAPDAGWSAGSEGLALPAAGAVTEFEAIQIGLAYAL